MNYRNAFGFNTEYLLVDEVIGFEPWTNVTGNSPFVQCAYSCGDGCTKQVLAMENLQRQLERQEGLMSHIQKALGEYLEGQRQVNLSRYRDSQVPSSILGVKYTSL